MKTVEIIPIAESKLGKRGIDRDLVKTTIRNPMQTVEGHGGRKVAHGKFLRDGKEYLLRVIFEETDDAYVVITAYLTSQINRYWKED